MLKYNNISTCGILAYQLFALMPGKAQLKCLCKSKENYTNTIHDAISVGKPCIQI